MDFVRFARGSNQYVGPSLALGVWGVGTDKVKSLVVTQLPPVKSDHYNIYLGPSWKRIVEDRRGADTSLEKVQADLFIACTEESCDQIDREHCFPLNVTKDADADRDRWTQMLARRGVGELLCYYAPVAERQDERYRFAHSLNFLQMEPFESLLGLGYYDYILRTDADAVLFPGLLHVRPTGSGLVGHGYYGENITNHLVRYVAKKLLPDLGEPFRESPDATPPMQSTFYVQSKVFGKFVSILLKSTKALFGSAFDKKTCRELEALDVSIQFKQSYVRIENEKPPVGPKGSWICMWPFWMLYTSSLYGTRIAVEYALQNVTVTGALDALATHVSMEDRLMDSVIQSHMLGLKHSIKEYIPDVGICVAPNETIRGLQTQIRAKSEMREDGNDGQQDPMLGILAAMETVAYSTTPVPSTMYHRIAEIVLQHYREKNGCSEWPFREGGLGVLSEFGATVSVSDDSFIHTQKEIAWARRQASNREKMMVANEAEETRLNDELRGIRGEYDRLTAQDPAITAFSRSWCGNCPWKKATTCNKRRDFLMGTYKRGMYDMMMVLQEQEPKCVMRRNITNWCGECMLETTTCNQRMSVLMAQERLTKGEAMSVLSEVEPPCVGRNATKNKWCGKCIWRGETSCEKRKHFLELNHKLNQSFAMSAVMKQEPRCIRTN